MESDNISGCEVAEELDVFVKKKWKTGEMKIFAPRSLYHSYQILKINIVMNSVLK
jgi:hypothetical protein